MKTYKPPGHDERLAAFAQRLNRALLARGWSGADLAREASRHVPKTHKDKKTGKQFELGRHLISAYTRGANEPTEANLKYIALALDMRPDELLPPVAGEGGQRHFAQATTTLEGKTRLVVDTEVDGELALKVLTLLRDAEKKTRNAA